MENYIEQDCRRFVADQEALLRNFKNKSILVTGATGLIGKHLIFSLAYANRILKLGMTVIAMVRSETKAKKVFATIKDDVLLYVSDIMKPLTYSGSIDYIIHGASVTSSKAFVDEPIETIMTAIEGTRNVLELARKKNIDGLVYLSSLEVYGSHSEKELISENDYGYIDINNVRSSYSEGKRIVECLCVSYVKQYRLPIKIARLTQTFGPGVDYRDNRVFAQFARSVIEGRNIVLHTLGDTKRNYCYTSDAVSAICYILEYGEIGQAYNVANKATYVSIKELAEAMLSLNFNPNSRLIFDLQEESKFGYNPTVKINLQTDKLECLGWQAQVALPEMLSNLVRDMALCREGGY